jgi:phosphoadenosine phosphosulfate reductase
MSIDAQLSQRIENAVALLRDIYNSHNDVAFANSFGAEDMVLTDLISKHAPEIQIFSLDTGRLPAETYALLDKTVSHYGITINTYFPDATKVEQYITNKGANAFYNSVEERKECCFIRKVEPLKRALAGKAAWITGLRREQAATRTELPAAEWDEGNGLHKFNPLTEWSQDDVWNYIKHFEVPYNELHDKSFPSIGCAPCTRAIAAGEDLRAGRWWWEDPLSKECGLHVKKQTAA